MRVSKFVVTVTILMVASAVIGGHAFAAPPKLVAPPAVIADVEAKRAAGWKLTELGELVAARVPVKFNGSSGMVLLATTDDVSLAASPVIAASHVSASTADLVAPRAAPATRKKQQARCIDKNQRRLSMTAGAGFICTWGQRANVQWTSQSGGAYTRFTLQDLQWRYFNAPPLYGYCQQLGCLWYSFHQPPPNVRVVFVEVENLNYARIDNTWCG